ncbi:MAG: hypothetical protein IJG34_01415 [Synergistaceae bacterium]|nr:hypothetical protein [Synergistaceae bacterium]MBQ3448546.1 hypothetical protein [Synergistaceae bacterium]MBQ3693592.1 hypothetical protein [Synergistaceae bacterium]MBQ6111397.1 hypothetical protein [Synergistaceae bacterium]MBQ9629304.1 hypothetical protein [Synergistaceae bacterium]
MKKFILTLMITLIFTASACAASSDDIYVRKDVFDVHMQNINSKLELILTELQAQKNEIKSMRNDINELSKTVAVLSERINRNFDTLSERIEGVNTSLSARIDGINASLSARIDGLDNRVSDLRNDIYLGLVVLGIIVGLPNIQKFFQRREANRREAHKPAFTLEDVERLIDAKLSSKSQ